MQLFSFFGLQLEASCLQWSFFYLQLTIFSLFTYNWSFLLTVLAFLLTVGFFAYNGKVHLIRALRDCKQRSLTVSKKAPTASKQTSPLSFGVGSCGFVVFLPFTLPSLQ